MKKYSGKKLAGNGKIEKIAGEEDGWRMILLEFPSFEKAKEFYTSPDYSELIKLREQAMKLDAVILEGT